MTGRNAICLSVAALVLLGLAWQIIANTAADTALRSNPEAALAWRPDSAPALIAIGEHRLRAEPTTDGDLADVAALGRRGLIASPLSAGALRLVGVTADLMGDEVRATTLMRLAGDRSRRDAETWLWLFDQHVRNGDYAKAMAAADPILRTEPSAADILLPALMSIAALPDGQAAVLDALAQAPPWRGWLLRQLARDPAGRPAVDALLAGLAKTTHPPRTDELRPYIDQLIGDGQYLVAFLAWMNFLPADELLSLPFMYNGDFEKPVTNIAFDWVLSPIRGAVTEVVDIGAQGTGKALRVVFSDTRVPYRHAAKLLVLPPGAYELTGRAQAAALTTPRGLRWRIACADGDRQLLSESEAFAGTAPWHLFRVAFTVPPSNCTAQWLRLELDARVASDQQITGTLWVDALEVRRADLGPSPIETSAQ